MTKILYDGITFDDVLLLPRYSVVLPRNVSLKTRLSRSIELNIPIVNIVINSCRISWVVIASQLTSGIAEVGELVFRLPGADA